MKSKAVYWVGWVLSILVSALMTLSAAMKLVKAEPAIKGLTSEFGYSESVIIPLGITEMLCMILYMIPRTAVLGAILLTGYLGGAVATHLRVGEVFAMPAILGVLVWLGLYLRDPRIRALIPFCSKPAQ